MRRRVLVATVFVLVVVISVSVIISLEKQSPVTLPDGEVTQYQGKNLSSISEELVSGISGPQHINASTYRLQVQGLVRNPKSYTYGEVVGGFQSYQKVLTLDCVEGWSVTILWKGVLVRDLINEAGALPNAKVVILRAYDGYSTSFPIDYLMNNNIMVAYNVNNITLPAESGWPFQLVAESKWGYKWIKWITEIELSNDTSFRGYWESRGYTNSGDRNSTSLGD